MPKVTFPKPMKPKPLTLPKGKAWQFMARDKKRELLRAIMAPTLAECEACVLTNPDDREFLLASLVEAVLGDP